ncbi:hypothetical protein N658DRAFT_227322 [Parathielavia hyrcaniae]|uniref:Uncharacterized protein n=1 Tax=Parathielavia hyrcaniae TaxID=113614 RepID=A0AAN6PUI4_9PEZI|nr:hypothetical protein N658DRAFT_227322 [Parathielavia hyrcaniae]
MRTTFLFLPSCPRRQLPVGRPLFPELTSTYHVVSSSGFVCPSFFFCASLLLLLLGSGGQRDAVRTTMYVPPRRPGQDAAGAVEGGPGKGQHAPTAVPSRLDAPGSRNSRGDSRGKRVMMMAAPKQQAATRRRPSRRGHVPIPTAPAWMAASSSLLVLCKG